MWTNLAWPIAFLVFIVIFKDEIKSLLLALVNMSNKTSQSVDGYTISMLGKEYLSFLVQLGRPIA